MKKLFRLIIFYFCLNFSLQREVLLSFPGARSSAPQPPDGYPGYNNCGFAYHLPSTWVVDADGKEHRPYYLNVTADRLAKEGFNIEVHEMMSDQIKNMTYSNGSFTGHLEFVGYHAVLPVGGRPALPIRAHGMAIIGERKNGSTQWFCDGALINSRWVLSAAHCFLDPNLNGNVVRLGEYDLSTDEDFGGKRTPYYDQTLDFEIEELIPYPEFKIRQRYHDLVLLKLDRTYPEISFRIQPYCLPWGQFREIDNFVGLNVTLTGWGATGFAKHYEKTNVLQEVDIEVFDTGVCSAAYENLSATKSKYPYGFTDEDILCAGSKEGGKDACQGDSGGPIVLDHGISMILVGIVSGGHGCGLKEYPGLYIPISKPKYLQWIKDVAFRDFVN